jgi:hypothetical protein
MMTKLSRSRRRLQPQKDPGTKTTIEWPSSDLEEDIFRLGLHMSCNQTWVIRKLYHSYGTSGPPIKEAKHPSALYSPFVTSVFINIKPLDKELLPL